MRTGSVRWSAFAIALAATLGAPALLACGSESSPGEADGTRPDSSTIADDAEGGVRDSGAASDGALDSAAPDASDAGAGFGHRLAAGLQASCALSVIGSVKCWGFNGQAVLGTGDTANRGDGPNEMGVQLPLLALGLGRSARQIVMGSAHACALLDDGTVKCWGTSGVDQGQGGLGEVDIRGDAPGEMGDALPSVALGTGRKALELAAGYAHTCALLDDKSVKCWGANDFGQLGLGDQNARGDEPNEMGDSLAAVRLGAGRTAKQVSAGAQFSCAVLDDDSVKCWGINNLGKLGAGDTLNRGGSPGDMGDALPRVLLGTGRKARQVGCGGQHACARLDDGTVKCWGDNLNGQLGLGDKVVRGDGPGEMGDALPAVALGTGRTAVDLRVGFSHACARLDDGALKCWGYNSAGALGLGDMIDRGAALGQMGDALPAVDLGTGRSAIAVALGVDHSCALLDDATLRCWGGNNSGQLGLGDTMGRGGAPSQMGDSLSPVVVW